MDSQNNRSCSHQLNLLVIAVWIISIVVSVVPVDAHPAGNVGQGTHFFIQNTGQFDTSARFVLESSHSRLWLADDGLWLTWFHPQPGGDELLAGVNLHISFLGADPHAQLQPLGRLETQVNYLGSGEPLTASTWSAVAYIGLYPGIDLIIDASSPTGAELLSWRLVAAPTADLSQVQLRITGAYSLQATPGHLLLRTSLGELSLPLIEIQPRQLLRFSNVSPQISTLGDGQFDVTTPLRLESSPHSAVLQASSDKLVYSTYLGGSAWEAGYAIALGQDGSIYVAGRTASPDFPTTIGAFDHSIAQVDAFIVKLDPTGGHLVYSTVLGGAGSDAAYSLALAGDQVYVTGETQSADFPITSGAFDTTCGSDGTCNSGVQGPITDAFLAELSSNGSQLIYSTFLGGKDEDHGYGLAVDGQKVYLTGITYSPDFPASGYKANGDAFVISFDGSHKLVYATLLGGSDVDAGLAIAVRGGEAFITGETSSPDFPAQPYHGGRELFLARLAGTGSLVNASLIGGSGDERGNSIALDPSGNIAIVGWTTSPDLPVTAGTYEGNGDALILKANPQTAVSYLAYFGGTGFDEGQGIAISASGSLLITGFTASTDFPVTSQAIQLKLNGMGDAFIAQLDPSAIPAAQLIYSTYLGGAGRDNGQALVYSQADQVYLTGYTQSKDFPMTSPNLDAVLNGIQDVFISGLIVAGTPGPIPTLPSPTPTKIAPTPTLILPTQTATGVGAPLATTSLTSVPAQTSEIATTFPMATQSSATPVPVGSTGTATPAPQITPGALATILQASPSAAGQVIETLAVTQPLTPEAVKTQTSTPASESGQKVGSLWLIVPVILAVIALIAWLVYYTKRV